MTSPVREQPWRWAATVLGGCVGGAALAQAPALYPTGPTPTEPTVEIIYGTHRQAPPTTVFRVVPVPVPTPVPVPMLPPTVTPARHEVPSATSAELYATTRDIMSAIAQWKPSLPQWGPFIFVTTPAAAPHELPPTLTTPAQPTVVMMPTPAPVAAHTDWGLLAFGLLAGLGTAGGLVLWSRRTAVPPAPPPPPPGARLIGGLYAGDITAPAEKFDLGPSFQDEATLKAVAQAAAEEAVVQDVLKQNLAMMAALDGLGDQAE